MSHTVYLGSFSKKLNSTKQPTYSGWSSYDCVFKEDTDLYRPTVRIAADFGTLAGSNINYAVMLNRYYWVTEIRAVRTGYTEVDMTVDPLATWKSSITGTSAFIEYGFNTFNAGDSGSRVPDKRISVKENPLMYSNDYDISGGILSKNTGCYVVQAVGNNPGGAHKGLAAFVLDQSDMIQLMTAINSSLSTQINGIMSNSSLTAQDVANELMAMSLQTELLNESAMAAIQSVKWLPLLRSSAVGTLTELYLGNYGTGVQAVMLSQSSIYKYDKSMSIPWPVSDWERNNCQLILYLPFFGTVPIPTDQAIDNTTVYTEWTTEYYSGSVSVLVSVGNYIVYAGSTNISVDMGIGRSQVGTSSLIGGGLQAMTGAMEMAGGAVDIGATVIGSMLPISGRSFAQTLSSIPNGAAQMFAGKAQMVQPAITCAGQMGGMAAIGQTQDASITVIYYPAIDKSGFSAIYGHPVMKIATPASGFCKTRGFSVAAAAPGSFAGMINSAMDGGVFIE